MTVADQPIDPGALIRSRGYIVLLVLAGVVGMIASIAGWPFLEVTTAMQRRVYEDLPRSLGFAAAPLGGRSRPSRWPGCSSASRSTGCRDTAGTGRPVGWRGAPTAPAELPGVLLAAVAGIGWGRPRPGGAPARARRRAWRDDDHAARQGAPDEVRPVMGAAGSFAAISTIFGNPVIGAVIIIEAAGLRPTLPLVLLPGLGRQASGPSSSSAWEPLGTEPGGLRWRRSPATVAGADRGRLHPGDRLGGAAPRSSSASCSRSPGRRATW